MLVVTLMICDNGEYQKGRFEGGKVKGEDPERSIILLSFVRILVNISSWVDMDCSIVGLGEFVMDSSEILSGL